MPLSESNYEDTIHVARSINKLDDVNWLIKDVSNRSVDSARELQTAQDAIQEAIDALNLALRGL